MSIGHWLSLGKRGFTGCCPRCGEGTLFSGFLTLAPKCEKCALDFSFCDSGDGPAIFVILLGGLLVLATAMSIELTYQPAFWIYPFVVIPAILIFCLGLLRPFKGLFIGLQYGYQAEEGKVKEEEKDKEKESD